MSHESETAAEPRPPAGTLSRFAYRLSDWSGWIAGLALICIFLLVMAEILIRAIAGRSTIIAEEYAGYLNVAVVFFGFSYALTRGSFIRVSLIYDLLKGKARRVAQWYIVLASLIYILAILFYMTKYTLYSYRFHTVSTNISATPQYIPQIIVLIGTFIVLLVLVAYVIDRCRNIP